MKIREDGRLTTAQAKCEFIGKDIVRMEPHYVLSDVERKTAFDLAAEVDGVGATRRSFKLYCRSLGVRFDVFKNEAVNFGFDSSAPTKVIFKQLMSTKLCLDTAVCFYARCQTMYDWLKGWRGDWHVIRLCDKNKADHVVVLSKWDQDRNLGYGRKDDDLYRTYLCCDHHDCNFGVLNQADYDYYTDLGDEIEALKTAGIEVSSFKYNSATGQLATRDR